MNSIPTDGYTLPDDTNHTSLPFTPHLLETQDNEASTFLNGFSNDLLAFGDFNVDADVVSTPHHTTLPRHVNPLPTFGGPPPANILATVAPHLTIDPLGVYTLDTHPSSSLSDGLSSPMFDNGSHVGAGVLTPQSADFDGFPQSNTHPPAIAPQLAVDVLDGSGEQLSLSGIQNIPMIPVMAPALAPSSSLTWMTSVSPTPEPLVRPWDASATLMSPAASASAASTSMRAEPESRDGGPFPVARVAIVFSRWFASMTPSSGSGQT
ncbi:hypothetical protein BJV77DRAFT_1071380 [Russula vinacea]|nr:hypothetical protein BJV77DRAFT_1071380 [Russula vinacea]